MNFESDWQGVRKILCIRLDSLGDVLMTSPAIRALKQGNLDSRITLLTSSSGAPAASLIAEIDQTLIYDPPWMKATAPASDASAELHMIDRLKGLGFDAAIIFTTFSQSPLPAALMTFMAQVPVRLAHCRENPYQLLTHWLPELDDRGGFEMRHEVRRQLDLVACIGCTLHDERIQLSVPAAALARVSAMLADAHMDVNQPWVIVHPGASAPSRRYPPESYAAAVRELTRHYGFQVVFTGGPGEVELVEHVRKLVQARSFSLAGRLNLEEFAAVLSLSPLLISNNSGPVHLAAGVGTPVVDLYALTNPQHTPWMLPHRTLFHDVPCKFCYKSICPMGHHNCLRLVPPAAVVDAALDLLGDGLH